MALLYPKLSHPFHAVALADIPKLSVYLPDLSGYPESFRIIHLLEL